jgi:hypothetical protein
MPLNEKTHINLVKTAAPITENTPIPILTADGNFEVKESIVLNMLVVIGLFPILCYEMYTQINHFITDKRDYAALICSASFLLLMIGTLIKLFNRKPVILINQQGVYIHGNLVTNWVHFVDVKFQERQRRYTFRFVLLVYYYKDGGEYYVFETPLTSTQNKAEEEVVDAIRYFHQLSQTGESITV